MEAEDLELQQQEDDNNVTQVAIGGRKHRKRSHKSRKPHKSRKSRKPHKSRKSKHGKKHGKKH